MSDDNMKDGMPQPPGLESRGFSFAPVGWLTFLRYKPGKFIGLYRSDSYPDHAAIAPYRIEAYSYGIVLGDSDENL